MKILLAILLSTCLITSGSQGWITDFSKAKSEAAVSNKLILLNFSGSDWCIPCIRLHKEVFESEPFKKFADTHLVLVNADFPRLRKNQLSKEQTKQNEALAEKYNSQGSFPLTVLIDAKGNVLKKWEGFPKEGTDAFMEDIGRFTQP